MNEEFSQFIDANSQIYLNEESFTNTPSNFQSNQQTMDNKNTLNQKTYSQVNNHSSNQQMTSDYQQQNQIIDLFNQSSIKNEDIEIKDQSMKETGKFNQQDSQQKLKEQINENQQWHKVNIVKRRNTNAVTENNLTNEQSNTQNTSQNNRIAARNIMKYKQQQSNVQRQESKISTNILDQEQNTFNPSSMKKELISLNDQFKKQKSMKDYEQVPLPVFDCIYCCQEHYVLFKTNERIVNSKYSVNHFDLNVTNFVLNQVKSTQKELKQAQAIRIDFKEELQRIKTTYRKKNYLPNVRSLILDRFKKKKQNPKQQEQLVQQEGQQKQKVAPKISQEEQKQQNLMLCEMLGTSIDDINLCLHVRNRRQRVLNNISFESDCHNIYDPCYTSEEEMDSIYYKQLSTNKKKKKGQDYEADDDSSWYNDSISDEQSSIHSENYGLNQNNQEELKKDANQMFEKLNQSKSQNQINSLSEVEDENPAYKGSHSLKQDDENSISSIEKQENDDDEEFDETVDEQIEYNDQFLKQQVLEGQFNPHLLPDHTPSYLPYKKMNTNAHCKDDESERLTFGCATPPQDDQKLTFTQGINNSLSPVRNLANLTNCQNVIRINDYLDTKLLQDHNISGKNNSTQKNHMFIGSSPFSSDQKNQLNNLSLYNNNHHHLHFFHNNNHNQIQNIKQRNRVANTEENFITQIENERSIVQSSYDTESKAFGNMIKNLKFNNTNNPQYTYNDEQLDSIQDQSKEAMEKSLETRIMTRELNQNQVYKTNQDSQITIRFKPQSNFSIQSQKDTYNLPRQMNSNNEKVTFQIQSNSFTTTTNQNQQQKLVIKKENQTNGKHYKIVLNNDQMREIISNTAKKIMSSGQIQKKNERKTNQDDKQLNTQINNYSSDILPLNFTCKQSNTLDDINSPSDQEDQEAVIISKRGNPQNNQMKGQKKSVNQLSSHNQDLSQLIDQKNKFRQVHGITTINSSQQDDMKQDQKGNGFVNKIKMNNLSCNNKQSYFHKNSDGGSKASGLGLLTFQIQQQQNKTDEQINSINDLSHRNDANSLEGQKHSANQKNLISKILLCSQEFQNITKLQNKNILFPQQEPKNISKQIKFTQRDLNNFRSALCSNRYSTTSDNQAFMNALHAIQLEDTRVHNIDQDTQAEIEQSTFRYNGKSEKTAKYNSKGKQKVQKNSKSQKRQYSAIGQRKHRRDASQVSHQINGTINQATKNQTTSKNNRKKDSRQKSREITQNNPKKSKSKNKKQRKDSKGEEVYIDLLQNPQSLTRINPNKNQLYMSIQEPGSIEKIKQFESLGQNFVGPQSSQNQNRKLAFLNDSDVSYLKNNLSNNLNQITRKQSSNNTFQDQSNFSQQDISKNQYYCIMDQKNQELQNQQQQRRQKGSHDSVNLSNNLCDKTNSDGFVNNTVMSDSLSHRINYNNKLTSKAISMGVDQIAAINNTNVKPKNGQQFLNQDSLQNCYKQINQPNSSNGQFSLSQQSIKLSSNPQQLQFQQRVNQTINSNTNNQLINTTTSSTAMKNNFATSNVTFRGKQQNQRSNSKRKNSKSNKELKTRSNSKQNLNVQQKQNNHQQQTASHQLLLTQKIYSQDQGITKNINQNKSKQLKEKNKLKKLLMLSDNQIQQTNEHQQTQTGTNAQGKHQLLLMNQQKLMQFKEKLKQVQAPYMNQEFGVKRNSMQNQFKDSYKTNIDKIQKNNKSQNKSNPLLIQPNLQNTLQIISGNISQLNEQQFQTLKLVNERSSKDAQQSQYAQLKKNFNIQMQQLGQNNKSEYKKQ